MEKTYTEAKNLIIKAEEHADHAPPATKVIIRELIDMLQTFIDYNEWHQSNDYLSQKTIEKMTKEIAEIRKALYMGEG